MADFLIFFEYTCLTMIHGLWMLMVEMYGIYIDHVYLYIIYIYILIDNEGSYKGITL